MTTQWDNQDRYEGQVSIQYNEPDIKYNEVGYQYNGKLGTIWTELDREQS